MADYRPWWQPTPRDIRVWYVVPAKMWREHLGAVARARIMRTTSVSFPDVGRVATAVVGPVMRNSAQGSFVRMHLAPMRREERRRMPRGCECAHTVGKRGRGRR